MKPITISEQLLYNTVRLETLDGASGTGFFFNFKFEKGLVPVLITNKHVINDNKNETMKFFLHLGKDGEPFEENFEVVFQTLWHFHPTHDLCFTFVNPLFEEVKHRTGKDVFFIANDETLIFDKTKLNELTALEEVVMIGYPAGIWDKLHNFPNFRKGYTGSHPAYDFNENGIGVVDMACFPGSSGSPIYILNENGYSDKKGNNYIGQSRLIFLGVLFAGPTMNANGNISVVEIPTKQEIISNTKIMINLGNYVKSYELIKFRKIIERML